MKERAFFGASIVAAVAASSCCILPIVFALTGAGLVGASAMFETLRPYLLVVTFALLGYGFFLAYRKPATCCEPGSACGEPAKRTAGKAGLWIVTLVVLLVAAFPWYSGFVARLVLQ